MSTWVGHGTFRYLIQHYFWVPLRGCFWKILAFEMVASVKQMVLHNVGGHQSICWAPKHNKNAEEGWKAWGCSSWITQSHFKLKSHFKAHAFNLLTGVCFNLGKLCTVSWWTELSAEFDCKTDRLKWARMSAQWGQLSTSVYRFRKTFIFRRLRDSGPSAFTRVFNWEHLNSGIS